MSLTRFFIAGTIALVVVYLLVEVGSLRRDVDSLEERVEAVEGVVE